MPKTQEEMDRDEALLLSRLAGKTLSATETALLFKESNKLLLHHMHRDLVDPLRQELRALRTRVEELENERRLRRVA